MKKSVPFPIEQAQVTWTRGATDAAGGVEFVVAIARRDIIEEYEAVCRARALGSAWSMSRRST